MMIFCKRKTETKIISVRVMEVTLPNGNVEHVDADIMDISGGALVLYKRHYLGKAGSFKVAVKAYGVGQWLTVNPINIPRTT